MHKRIHCGNANAAEGNGLSDGVCAAEGQKGASQIAELQEKIDELQTQIDFFRDEELKLIKKYARTDENGQIQWLENERFAFEDTASAEEFKREREKLCMTQTDEPETLHAPIPERISPAQLEALEKFIRFGEE